MSLRNGRGRALGAETPPVGLFSVPNILLGSITVLTEFWEDAVLPASNPSSLLAQSPGYGRFGSRDSDGFEVHFSSEVWALRSIASRSLFESVTPKSNVRRPQSSVSGKAMVALAMRSKFPRAQPIKPSYGWVTRCASFWSWFLSQDVGASSPTCTRCLLAIVAMDAASKSKACVSNCWCCLMIH